MSDFMEVFGDWLVDGTTVQIVEAVGIEGDQYAAPVTVDQIMIEFKRRLVRDTNGEELLSERALYVPRESPHVGLFVPGARVTFNDGVISNIIRLSDFAPYGVIDHLVVMCE